MLEEVEGADGADRLRRQTPDIVAELAAVQAR
jgi:hypothetical protein